MRRIFVLLALALAVTITSSTAAGAQTDTGTYGGTPPVGVGGDEATPPGGPTDVGGDTAAPQTEGPSVLGDTVNRGGLPVTGGDLVGLTALGFGAIALGAALVATRRRAADAR